MQVYQSAEPEQMRSNVTITEEMENIMTAASEWAVRKYGSRYDWYSNESEDMFQEIFLKLLIKLGQYDPGRNSSFKTFIYCVSENAARDYVRKKKSKPELINRVLRTEIDNERQSDDQKLTEYVPGNKRKEPEFALMEKERKKEIEDILFSIPEKYRDYMIYRFGFYGNDEHEADETRYHFYLPEKYGKRLEREALDSFREKFCIKRDDKIHYLRKRKRQKWIFLYPAV